MPASIELRHVDVDAPGGEPILRGIDLTIGAGDAVALVGRSGAGKTTTLRLINGLARPTRGEVLVDGTPLSASDLIALRRRTGYIIQSSGLFPHRTVYENVGTIPRLLGWVEERIREAAARVMAQLGMPLDRFGSRYPASLSGGEQQRVGIARAIVANPVLILCDEPFGALDPIVRRELQDAFVAIREKAEATIVFVTHDLAEAMRVAERIVLFDGGKTVADTNAAEFVRCPLPLAQQFVASATLPA